MSLSAEPEEQSAGVVAKYAVIPAKESDHPNALVWTIKTLKKHLANIPLYLIPRWYKAKVDQEENKALLDKARVEALLLDARGQYEERAARAEKTREETKAMRFKNDAESQASRDAKADELLHNFRQAWKIIVAKGGAVELDLPNLEEPEQVIGSGDILVPGTRGQGSAITMGRLADSSKTTAISEYITNQQAVEAQGIVTMPPVEAQGTILVAPQDEVRSGTISQAPPKTPEPIVGTSAAQAQPATSQATGTVGKPQSIFFDSVVARGVVEATRVTSVEPEHLEPPSQEPQRKEPPPTFGMGMKLGID